MPCGQARAVRLRAPLRARGGLPDVPQPARLHERQAAYPPGGLHAVPPVSQRRRFRNPQSRCGHSVQPAQPARSQIPEMHHLSRAHSRVERGLELPQVTAMLKRSSLLFAVLGVLQAQQVVAPTPATVGSPRGDGWGGYNVTQSFETGYRFHLVGGSFGEYRSDVNYGNGLRLLGSNFSIDSKDGHGRWFDEILLNTTGLGNDPYQNATLRVQKNGLYRYDMTWRLSDSFTPGLTVAGGSHLMDTSRRLQDHEITLLPQSAIRFHLGYSRDTEDGPALSTASEFDANGSGYPVFTNVRRQW